MFDPPAGPETMSIRREKELFNLEAGNASGILNTRIVVKVTAALRWRQAGRSAHASNPSDPSLMNSAAGF